MTVITDFYHKDNQEYLESFINKKLKSIETGEYFVSLLFEDDKELIICGCISLMNS